MMFKCFYIYIYISIYHELSLKTPSFESFRNSAEILLSILVKGLLLSARIKMNIKTKIKFRQIDKNDEVDQTTQEHRDLRGSAIFAYVHEPISKIYYIKYRKHKLQQEFLDRLNLYKHYSYLCRRISLTIISL